MKTNLSIGCKIRFFHNYCANKQINMSQQWANYVNQTVATFPAQFGITTNDASNFGYLIHEYGQGANLAC